MAKKYQTKRFKNNKIQIWKSLGLLDFLIIAIIIVIGIVFGIASGLEIHLGFKFLISVAIWLILTPLVKKSKRHNVRGYMVLLYLFTYIARPKKYRADAKGNLNTSSLVPYDQIKDGYLKTGSFYVGGVHVDGKNISLENEEDQKQYVQLLTEALSKIPYKSTIVKLPKRNNLDINKKAVNEAINNLKKSITYKNQTWKEKILTAFENDFENHWENQLMSDYYVIFYHTNLEELKKAIMLFTNDLNNINLITEELTLRETLNLTLKIFNSEDEFDDEEYQLMLEGEKLEKFYKFDNLTFETDKFYIKDSNNEKKYYSAQTVREFGYILKDNWVHQFFASDSVVVWHLNKLDETVRDKLIGNTAKNLTTNVNEEKTIIGKRRYGLEGQAMDDLIDKAALGEEAIFKSTIIFLNQADSKKTLKEKNKVNKINLVAIPAYINPLKYRQFEGYSELHLKSPDMLKEFIEQPASNIAFAWPFISERLNDGNFNLLGQSLTDATPIFFDLFNNNEQRKNNNLTIMGTSGSGKSTLTKKFMANAILNNQKIILLDPQNEYAPSGRKMGVEIIDIGANDNTVFNPLQIRKAFNPVALDKANQEDDKDFGVGDNNAKIINIYESSTLKKFFQTLFEELNKHQINSIIENVRELYKNPKFQNLKTSITELKNDEYPILDDLITTYEKNLKKINYLTEIQKLQVLNSLKFSFGKDGDLRHLYNGHTNFEMKSNYTIFNVAPLLEYEPKIYQAGFFLILSYIQGKVAENWIDSYKTKQKLSLIIDEAHRFIDEKNDIALDFIYTTAKTIRKFGGGLILTTQNPKDFAVSGDGLRKSQAIIENCQYSIFFQLKSQDVDEVDKLFKSSGGLTKSERNFITRAKTGEFLFSVNTNKRMLVDAYYNDLEKQLFFDQGDKRKNNQQIKQINKRK
ncbi:Mbov_0397 family ICE element conjugal transfer ATPase [Candidatus Mycoplasma pogonae]